MTGMERTQLREPDMNRCERPMYGVRVRTRPDYVHSLWPGRDLRPRLQ
jgi:hypothetical protein